MAVPLKKLEDKLNCPICLDTYTNPKQLLCDHVYCQQCLGKLVSRDRQGKLFLTCPNCCQATPVPANGVAGLKEAFRVNQFLEIVQEHKKASGKLENDSTSPALGQNITVVCPMHDGKEVALYCETCEETICWECIMKGNKHHSHEYQKLNDAFEKYKEEIFSSLEPLENQLTIIGEALKAFDTCVDEISDRRAAIETSIHNTITKLQSRLHQTLEVRKTELICQLDQLTQAKLKSLAAQRDQIETTQAQLSSCLLFLRENLKTDNQEKALMMKSTTVSQVKELTTTFQPDMLKPKKEADIIFSAVGDLSAACRSYGNLYLESPPEPTEFSVTGKGTHTAVVREKSNAFLHIRDFSKKPGKMFLISCKLVSNITGDITQCSLATIGENQYKISYQPTIKGRHQLHIKVDEQHIKGSPFPVCVTSPVENISTPIMTIGEVSKPEGVAVNQKGEVVVTEQVKNCVTVLSPSGKRLRSFGKFGSGQGQFDQPHGLGVDAKGNILVADCHNNRIQKFTSQGVFITAVGIKGSGPLQFLYPVGIAVSASTGRIYIVENGNNRVQILNSDLSCMGTFGKKGSGKGQFKNPWYIACDSTGNVYIADSGNDRIQVFTAEGIFLRMFGRGKGKLESARGLAIDSGDRVYVSESWNHRVSVFTSVGQLVTSFSSKKEGQFKSPHGLAVDASGVVYVCDLFNNRLQLF